MRQIAKWLLGTALATAVVSAGGCAGDQPGTQEPTKDAGSKVPDMPGGSGEAKDKPAGTGQANPVTPTPAPKAEPADGAKASKGKHGAKAAAVNLKAGDATVEAPSLNVRASGSSKGAVKRTLKKGEKVTIKECKAGWCQIGDGEWVSASMLKQ